MEQPKRFEIILFCSTITLIDLIVKYRNSHAASKNISNNSIPPIQKAEAIPGVIHPLAESVTLCVGGVPKQENKTLILHVREDKQ